MRANKSEFTAGLESPSGSGPSPFGAAKAAPANTDPPAKVVNNSFFMAIPTLAHPTRRLTIRQLPQNEENQAVAGRTQSGIGRLKPLSLSPLICNRCFGEGAPSSTPIPNPPFAPRLF
jgi:hypothetical protein